MNRLLGSGVTRVKSFCTFTIAAASTFAGAQLIVGNDQTGVTSLYKIDVNTKVATPILSENSNRTKPWGMAADNVNSILYWNNGSTLYSATYSSLLGTPVINQVAMTYNAASVNFVALAFDPINQQLLGTRNIATESVYIINPLTGVCTIKHSHPTAFDFGGLDCAEDGTLYGLSDTAPTGSVRGLYRIESDVSQVFIAGYPAGETDIDGLAVGNGRAYYVTDGPNTAQANFYVYDIASATQVDTIPSPFTGSGTFCAAAWAPGLLNGTVAGTVTLEDYDPDEMGREVVIEVLLAGVPVETQNVTLGAGGDYSFTTALSGVYDIACKGSHWLRRVVTGVTLTPGSTSNAIFSLTNGDADPDNEVNLVDAATISAAFGSVEGDLNWNAEADLNGDGEVNLVDYGIMSAMFGQAGD